MWKYQKEHNLIPSHTPHLHFPWPAVTILGTAFLISTARMANRTESISGWRAKEYRTRQEIEHRKLSSRADDYNGGFRPGTSQAPFFTAPAHVSRGAVILSTPSPSPVPKSPPACAGPSPCHALPGLRSGPHSQSPFKTA